eukprot:Sspe_Gene.68954::Locus_40642_Transcript_1_2_Confidence_0.667_Length_2202::g.68954::m.68954
MVVCGVCLRRPAQYHCAECPCEGRYQCGECDKREHASLILGTSGHLRTSTQGDTVVLPLADHEEHWLCMLRDFNAVLRTPAPTSEELCASPFGSVLRIIEEVMRDTGFGSGLYTTAELHATTEVARERLVEKWVSFVGQCLGMRMACRAGDIVQGRCPKATTWLLQCTLRAVRTTPTSVWGEAVGAVLEAGSAVPADRPPEAPCNALRELIKDEEAGRDAVRWGYETTWGVLSVCWEVLQGSAVHERGLREELAGVAEGGRVATQRSLRLERVVREQEGLLGDMERSLRRAEDRGDRLSLRVTQLEVESAMRRNRCEVEEAERSQREVLEGWQRGVLLVWREEEAEWGGVMDGLHGVRRTLGAVWDLFDDVARALLTCMSESTLLTGEILHAANTACNCADEKMKASEEQHEILRAELREIEDQLNAVTGELKKVEGERADEVEALEAKLREAASRSESAEARLHSREQEMAKVEGLRERVLELEAKVEEMEGRASEIEALRAAVAEAEGRRAHEVGELEAKVTALKKDLEDKAELAEGNPAPRSPQSAPGGSRVGGPGWDASRHALHLARFAQRVHRGEVPREDLLSLVKDDSSTSSSSSAPSGATGPPQ